MPYGFNAKWKSNKFDRCVATVIEDLGEEVKISIRHSDEHYETIIVTKSYLNKNYTLVYMGFNKNK